MNRNLPEPTSREKSHDGQQSEWVAGRIQTLLSHYYQPDNPADVTMEALTDWVAMLSGMTQAAISHACDSYLRDQPRRRPTPGDIYARAKAHDEQTRRKAAAGGPLSAAQIEVVDWACQSGRLSRGDALDAVATPHEFPMWLPDDERQRAVYGVRHHPHHREPN